ncbi:MAG: UDP-N-acetylglucosamine--LPS N-acetylglucosamine transferase [Candidatus Hydrogenedentes bacterium]|nr:UDP-N-acetylglucosamine--LPS N-acetylglucosamine transferase [Candidatus Hydrogenedentota bacterium]
MLQTERDVERTLSTSFINPPPEAGLPQRKKKFLAVSSGGGHWVQMLRIAHVFRGQDVTFVTVDKMYASDVPGMRLYAVADATEWNKLKLIVQAFQLLVILIRERPDFVVSTGAAPGFFAIRLGKLLGAHTVWIDSIANVERLSKAGQKVELYADLWLTQWPHLELDSGPYYRGAVL